MSKLTAVFLIVLIDLIGFGLIIPLLPFYGSFFGASPEIVGLLMACYSLAQFIAAPFWGALSDRKGRRPVLLISLAGLTLSYVMLAFADTLAMLFAARLFGGLMAGNISAAFAYVADITTREDRGKGMGMIGAAFSLGFILGPAVGGVLAGPDAATADYTTPSLAAGGFSAVALVFGFFMLKESLPPGVRAEKTKQPRATRARKFKEALALPGVGLMMLLGFIATFVFAGLETTFALWSARRFGWGPEQNGWIFAYVGFISAAIQGGMIGRLKKRFGERNLLAQGAVALSIGLFAMPFAGELWMLLIVLGVAAYGFSVINPTFTSLISQIVPETEQGGVLGVTRSVVTLSRIGGPVFFGALLGLAALDAPYFAGAAIMLTVPALALINPKPRSGGARPKA